MYNIERLSESEAHKRMNFYAYRWVCKECNVVRVLNSRSYFTNYRINEICGECGREMVNVLCRSLQSRLNPFVWYNPKTWNNYSCRWLVIIKD